MYLVQIVIRNEFGEFRGEVVKATYDQYQNIIELSKGFYLTGFEMMLEDGKFIVIPHDIVKRSILLIEKNLI